jgi:hypothetical protein
MRFKTPAPLFNGEHAACLLIDPTINIQRGYVVGAFIVKGFNFMHNTHTIGKKVHIFFMDKMNCTK